MKKKKALAFAMALVMSLSFGGCAKKTSDKNSYPEPPKGEIVDTLTTDDGIQINIVKEDFTELKIGNRTYKVYEDRITYEVQEGDNDWSIARDFNLEEDDIRKFNSMDSDLMYPGDKIVIPRRLFDNSSDYVGIEVSEETGEINWDLTQYFTDFVLVDVADFDCEMRKFHKYIEAKGGYDKAKEDPNFGMDYDEFEVGPIDENFDKNMKALAERNISHGVVAYGYLDDDEVDNPKKAGKEDADTVLDAISKYEFDYPVVLAIDDFAYSPMSYANGKCDSYKQNISKACLDYCLAFMNEIKNNDYDVFFCSDSDVYYNFVSKNGGVMEFPKIITDEYKEDEEPLNITGMQKKSDESVPGLEWSKRFCNTYVVNSKEESNSTKKSKPIKILIIGGVVVVLLSAALIGSIYCGLKTESELNELAPVKEKKKKKK